MMKGKPNITLNTLDRALASAKALSRMLSDRESKTYSAYRIFAALAGDEIEGLAAFMIWKARGEIIKDVLNMR